MKKKENSIDIALPKKENTLKNTRSKTSHYDAYTVF